MLIAAVRDSATAANKNHLSLFNNGGDPLEIWRVEVIPHYDATVTGTGTTHYLHRTTGLGTGGTPAVVRKSNNRGRPVPSSLQVQANVTLSPAAETELAGIAVSVEETGTAVGASKDELFQADPPRGIDPIVLWSGEGVVVRQAGLAGGGEISVFIYLRPMEKGARRALRHRLD